MNCKVDNISEEFPQRKIVEYDFENGFIGFLMQNTVTKLSMLIKKLKKFLRKDDDKS